AKTEEAQVEDLLKNGANMFGPLFGHRVYNSATLTQPARDLALWAVIYKPPLDATSSPQIARYLDHPSSLTTTRFNSQHSQLPHQSCLEKEKAAKSVASLAERPLPLVLMPRVPLAHPELFPVGRIHRMLKRGNYAQRVGAGAPVYLAA
ncbi:2204_t:CDS:2, partial [Acaulospora colombiana]